MKVVNIFTDGACIPNPGSGGWAAILRYKNVEKVISGYESKTTNNRMEITAFLSALKILKYPCEINLFSDSQYLVNAFSEGWLNKWASNNWKFTSKGKKEIKNPDLWKEIYKLSKQHKINAKWVRGHSGHLENERCDQLAMKEIQKNKLIYGR